MKAAVFRALGQPLQIEERPDPTPGPGEAVLAVGRCGICGSDLHVTEEPSRLAPPGTVLGHEWAGEVVALGKGVERLRTGDRVCVLPLSSCGACARCLAGEPAWCEKRRIDGGGYADLALTHERQCFRLPATLSLADGALVEPLAVGLHTIAVSGMAPGTDILVIGAGPIGLATVFWARRLGAGRIAVAASSTRREELAYRMGASAFVNPSEDPVAAAIEALGARPALVFECVGRPGLLAQAVDIARPRGTVVLSGLCWGADTLVPGVIVGKEVRIQPAAFYTAREFELAIAPLDGGAVEPRDMITDTVALADLPAAFEALRHRSHQCKVMVAPGA